MGEIEDDFRNAKLNLHARRPRRLTISTLIEQMYVREVPGDQLLRETTKNVAIISTQMKVMFVQESGYIPLKETSLTKDKSVCGWTAQDRSHKMCRGFQTVKGAVDAHPAFRWNGCSVG